MSRDLATLPVCIRDGGGTPYVEPLTKFGKGFTVNFSSGVHHQFGWRASPADPVVTEDRNQVISGLRW